MSSSIKTRTGQKDNHNWNVGLSIQATIPLDQGLQRRCKEAVDTQIAIQKQHLANKRLDFEISRLKHCGELKMKGIRFAKTVLTKRSAVTCSFTGPFHTLILSP